MDNRGMAFSGMHRRGSMYRVGDQGVQADCNSMHNTQIKT